MYPYSMRLVSLLFIIDSDRILLGKKKVRFGAGHWNGFGGGAEAGETIEESACRETKEECGLAVRPEDLTKVAHIEFVFTDKRDYDHDVHVFITNRYTGEPIETEEMQPQWHPLQNLPISEMWPSDVHWVPLVLQQGKTIEATCIFTGTEKPFTVGSFKYTETTF
jgi:8-oxo-dGTP diphosphatase/2-hydroxy-dATP diphosphatase